MKLILFRGRPGTGKTTISNKLSKELNIPVLRKDDIYDVTVDLIPEHQIRNKISYGALYSILESNRTSNCVFILDYPFSKPEDIVIIKKWCSDKEIDLKTILVICSDEKLWAERFNVRAKNPQPNQLITDFEKLKKHYGTIQPISEENELIIDTVQPLAELVVKVKNFI